MPSLDAESYLSIGCAVLSIIRIASTAQLIILDRRRRYVPLLSWAPAALAACFSALASLLLLGIEFGIDQLANANSVVNRISYASLLLNICMVGVFELLVCLFIYENFYRMVFLVVLVVYSLLLGISLLFMIRGNSSVALFILYSAITALFLILSLVYLVLIFGTRISGRQGTSHQNFRRQWTLRLFTGLCLAGALASIVILNLCHQQWINDDAWAANSIVSIIAFRISVAQLVPEGTPDNSYTDTRGDSSNTLHPSAGLSGEGSEVEMYHAALVSDDVPVG